MGLESSEGQTGLEVQDGFLTCLAVEATMDWSVEVVVLESAEALPYT